MSAGPEITRRKRWPLALAALAVFLVGFVAGGYCGLKVLREPMLWLGAVGQSYMVGEYSRAQYREAAYPEAKDALEKYLRCLDSAQPAGSRWKPGQNPWLDERGLAQDKAFTLARLALLEERNGHAEPAAELWSETEAQLVRAKWKTPSLDRLRTFVIRVDESNDGPSITPPPVKAK